MSDPQDWTYLAAHLAVALRRHEQWAEQQCAQLPAGFVEIRQLLAGVARAGQTGRVPADDAPAPDDRPPLLLTYLEVAVRLGCSDRTVKRLVSEGALVPVLFGGRVKIRSADLVAYVEGLPTADRTA